MKPRHILVINDDHALSEILQTYIEDEGFKFSLTADWEEGRYLAGIIKPDAIVLNTMGQIGRGFEFCNLLHRGLATGRIPVIFIYAKDKMPQKSGLHIVRADRYISLPIEKQTLLDSFHELIGETPAPASPPKPGHILLAEDDKVVMEFITEALEEEGYKITKASTGMETLSQALELKPDAIVLNLLLPDADGIELCELLLSDPATADIPIMIESAKKDMQTISKGFRAGARNYLVKPFSAEEMVSALRRLIEKKTD